MSIGCFEFDSRFLQFYKGFVFHYPYKDCVLIAKWTSNENQAERRNPRLSNTQNYDRSLTFANTSRIYDTCLALSPVKVFRKVDFM